MEDSDNKYPNENGKFRSREYFFKKHRETSKRYDDTCAENKYLLGQIALLENQITELQRKITDLESALSSTNKYDGYDSGWKQIRKVLFILKSNGSAMSSSEILDALLSLEPKFSDTWRNPKKSICRIIGRALKLGLLLKNDCGNQFRYSLINSQKHTT